jgi:hypothetical protein
MDFDSVSGLAPIIESAYDIRLGLVNKSTTTDRDFFHTWSKEACNKV